MPMGQTDRRTDAKPLHYASPIDEVSVTTRQPLYAYAAPDIVVLYVPNDFTLEEKHRDFNDVLLRCERT